MHTHAPVYNHTDNNNTHTHTQTHTTGAPFQGSVEQTVVGLLGEQTHVIQTVAMLYHQDMAHTFFSRLMDPRESECVEFA